MKTSVNPWLNLIVVLGLLLPVQPVSGQVEGVSIAPEPMPVTGQRTARLPIAASEREPTDTGSERVPSVDVLRQTAVITAVKTAPGAASPGDLITYDIIVTNTSSNTETIDVLDKIPLGIDYVDHLPPLSCSRYNIYLPLVLKDHAGTAVFPGKTSVITVGLDRTGTDAGCNALCWSGDLDPGETITLTWWGTVTGDPCSTIINEAVIESFEGELIASAETDVLLELSFSDPDPAPLNNPDAVDSVYWHNGAFTLSRTDLYIPGRGTSDYEFARIYNSRIGYDGPLGHGWQHNYDRWLYQDCDGNVTLVGEGRADTFIAAGGNSFTSPLGSYSKLTRNLDGTFTLRDPHGNQAFFNALDGSPAQGKLIGTANRNGNTMTLYYNSEGLLIEATDALSRTADYTYTGGRLTSVNIMGQQLDFTFDENGDLVEATKRGGLTLDVSWHYT